jgi:cytoskeletal protein CcmA (bactofilin family)
MIDLKKDAVEGATPAAKARDEAAAPPAPPSKSREENGKLKQQPSARVGLPEKPRRLPEMPEGRRSRTKQPRREDTKMLVVGPEIVLKGEIKSLDRLVVEGQVEAKMKDCREIEIAETGTFRGKVEFDRADISGVFEGDLTAREYLVVRSTGRVTGPIRFGELEIERGGQIIGDIQVFGEGAAAAKVVQEAVVKPEK